jgi:magnesium-transporting ATPase (P-type)
MALMVRKFHIIFFTNFLDVAMIQAATIGIGVIGREGSQAARASDYAIPRFRHLVRLIAVHGRYSYIRNSDYLHLSFYKNNMLVFMQLLLAFYSGFTGQTIFDSWTITMYNTIFALIPPLLAGVFEKDLTPETILKNPQLYPTLKNDALFNKKTFTIWMIIPIVHSLILFFGTYLMSYNGSIFGFPDDELWSWGTVAMNSALAVILLRTCLETKYWTWLTWVAFIFSYASYIVWEVCYNAVPFLPSWIGLSEYYWVYFEILSTWKGWLVHPLLIVMCILPDFIFK